MSDFLRILSILIPQEDAKLRKLSKTEGQIYRRSSARWIQFHLIGHLCSSPIYVFMKRGASHCSHLRTQAALAFLSLRSSLTSGGYPKNVSAAKLNFS